MKKSVLALMCTFALGCSHAPVTPLPRAKDVDIERFMGRWYVIANIPTFIEKGAHNAVESYDLNEDGSIATTFSFNKNSFDGELKTYTPTGFVSEQDNSLWGMQFIWPIKAEYVIAYLSQDYQHTIIARSARDYLWIMARTPSIDQKTLQDLFQLSADMGYDIKQIQLIPQQWNTNDQATNSETGHGD